MKCAVKFFAVRDTEGGGRYRYNIDAQVRHPEFRLLHIQKSALSADEALAALTPKDKARARRKLCGKRH